MNKHSKASLFLMELIIALLLFAVTSAVCVRVFVATHLTNEQSKALQFATIETQNIAEQIRADAWDFQTETLCFDRNFQKTFEDNARYRIQIQKTESKGLWEITIQTTDLEKSREIYTLSFQQYEDYSAREETKK